MFKVLLINRRKWHGEEIIFTSHSELKYGIKRAGIEDCSLRLAKLSGEASFIRITFYL
ncbi:hypothetical protein VDIAB_250064 [Vibrio diabolicus]|nr:hypothetical protein VDIAB_250064 [Vibrio diabolicus]